MHTSGGIIHRIALVASLGLLASGAATAMAAGPAGAATPATAPAAPTAVNAVPGSSNTSAAITVSWTVPADNGSAITEFSVAFSTGGKLFTTMPLLASSTGISPTPGASDSYTTLSLFSPNTTYSVTVAAVNDVGTGPASTPATVTTSLAEPNLVATQSSFSFDATTLGDISDNVTVEYTNQGQASDTVSSFNFGGADPDDFVQTADSNCTTAPVAPGGVCQVSIAFLPGALGTRTATMTAADSSPVSPVVSFSGSGTEGYYLATASGRVDTFGDAVSQGDLVGQPLPAPIISITSTGDNSGYWLLDSLGNVYNFGDAGYYGDTGSIHLNRPIVGMTPTADDGGYWLVASDGGIFSFGDAVFYGSTGSIHLNKPIVGMAATADGDGYWLVASDGGVFSYGDAQFYGSTGAIHLNKPIVGMAVTPDGGGYWMVATDGGIFSFGDADFYGSTGAIKLNQPIVGMAATPDGEGYWLDAADGGIFNFGDAPFYGSDGGAGITDSVGVALDGYYTFQASVDAPALRQLSRRGQR